MKHRKAVSFIISFIMFFTLCTGVVCAEDTSRNYDYIKELINYIDTYYYFDVDKEKLEDAALLAALTKPDEGLEGVITEVMGCLDENSAYIPADVLGCFMEEIVEGTFVGIGVRAINVNGRMVVSEPLKNSPAEKAGILPNDIIVAVDGVSLDGKDAQEAQNLIRGIEGTTVKIGVIRGEEYLSFDIVRATVEDVAVTYKVIDGAGYISVSQFTLTICDQVQEALNYFDTLSIDKIVIDLRGNTGGEIRAALGLCSMFVPKGVVARLEFKYDEMNQLYFSDLVNPKYDLAVLINGGTASASELFAGAVADTGTGILIGTQSFGKGTGQEVKKIVTGGAIRMTVAEYKTAGGRSVHKIGLEPHIKVENEVYYINPETFEEIDFYADYAEGTQSEAVLALEQRLEALGYFEATPDSLMDKYTVEAVKQYQAYRGLTVSGQCDAYTLADLNNIEYEKIKKTEDIQLQTAVDYLLGKGVK